MRVVVADQECFDDEGGNQRWQQSVLGFLFRCWRNDEFVLNVCRSCSLTVLYFVVWLKDSGPSLMSLTRTGFLIRAIMPA